MYFVAGAATTEIHLSEKPSKAKQPHPTWQLKIFFPVGAKNLTSMLQQDSRTRFETAVAILHSVCTPWLWSSALQGPILLVK